MTDNGADIIALKGARPAIHIRITKAVEGKARLPDFDPLAFQGIVVRCLRVAQRSRAQFAILQDFGVAQRDGLPDRSPDL